MNIKYIVCVLILFIVVSCSTTRGNKYSYDASSKAKIVLSKAHDFYGTPYKYGGEDRRGMDCSGLALVSYKEIGIELPRNSAEQADYGTKISLSSVKIGDMLFFDTSGRGISHAGIVDHIDNGEIFFIHASTSKGVMVSSLENKYWKKRFVKAVRYIR